ncbi:MAG TPA: EAL domain-containing protein, partial [Gemmataceae bacterium]|nr:EAL domain-containing protein [Gemmataceae bacterium]
SDRDYFNRLKYDPAFSEEVEVVASRFSSRKAVVFARRVSGPHGEFLGVVTRAIPPELLEAFFASAGLGADSSIAMHRDDGQLLARFPHVEAMIGANFKTGSAAQQAVFEQSSLSARLTSPVDGRDRLIASRRLAAEPLVIVATKTVDSTLATWRSQTKFFIAVATCSILLIVLTLYLIFRQMTRQLSVDKERLDCAINNLSQGLLLFDSGGRIIVSNRSFIDMYGLSSEVVKPGCTLEELVRHRKETGSFAGDVDKYCGAIMRDMHRAQNALLETSDGRLIEARKVPVASGGWLATHEDVTERIRAQERIAHLAHYDVLTELPNRVLMRGHLEHRVAQLAEGKPFAILYIDVDEFKGVNDTLGHEAGDELLRQVAQRLRSCVGPQDLVARLGGDEFAIVKEGAREQDTLSLLAEQIMQALRASVACRGQQLPIDASIGIAIAPDHGSSIEDLLRSADLAMYAAKSEGRRTYRFFTPALDAQVRTRRQMEIDLRQALSGGQFDIHYQPLVDLATDTVAGCEALLRWRHPERGMISPAEFIPVAEETGLINEIGEWVLKRACAEAAGWPQHVRLAVNVSPAQFGSKTLALRVASALEASGLAPDRLELEVTEAVLIRDDDEALTILHQLRDLGVRIALDDFGTGYSSLSYLRRFPFDKIKIDRSFVKDIAHPNGSSTIVHAVVTMAAACHMSTTAEGVETEAQREILRRLGCSQMQGFLFSPAVPAANLQTLLMKVAA